MFFLSSKTRLSTGYRLVTAMALSYGSLRGSASVWAEARLPLALPRGRHICGLAAFSRPREGLRLLSSDVIYGIALASSNVLESITGGRQFPLAAV